MLLRGKKVLVTGATGLIGSNLIKRLLDEGAQVRATLHSADPLIADPRIEYLRCDLTQAADCSRSVAGMQLVYLCAASTSGAAITAATPMIHVTPNVLMNSLMFEAAYEARVEKVLFLSSTITYPVSDKPMREEQVLEGEPFEKYYCASWAKRFAEILGRMYGEKLARRMPVIVLRPTNVYGPNDKFEFEKSHVIAALIRKSVERWDPFEVWGDGSEIRDAIYVDDMVDAMLLAMERIEAYDVINIGLGRGHSVREIMRMVFAADGFSNARVTFDPSKPTMIPVRLIDTSKAERVLGFRAKVGLEEGLRRTIDWYRATRGIPRP
jgi:GDP-L-fucose synthase